LANDGSKNNPEGRSLLIIVEKICRISEMPSQYHSGVTLNIGGQMQNFKEGDRVHDSKIRRLNSWITGSTRVPTAPVPWASQMKLVIQEITQTFDSFRIFLRASDKT
jgi:hypothetical protein